MRGFSTLEPFFYCLIIACQNKQILLWLYRPILNSILIFRSTKWSFLLPQFAQSRARLLSPVNSSKCLELASKAFSPPSQSSWAPIPSILPSNTLSSKPRASDTSTSRWRRCTPFWSLRKTPIFSKISKRSDFSRKSSQNIAGKEKSSLSSWLRFLLLYFWCFRKRYTYGGRVMYKRWWESVLWHFSYRSPYRQLSFISYQTWCLLVNFLLVVIHDSWLHMHLSNI